MGIHRLFSSGGVQQLWKFKVGGTIWRMLFSETGYIIGEERNEKERELGFFCLDRTDGRPVWRGRKYGREWWTGIFTIDGSTLYLHGYATPDMPEEKGIIAVRLPSGEIIWENPDLSIISAVEGRIVARRDLFARQQYIILDPASGAVAEELPDETAVRGFPPPGADEVHYRFPVPVEPDALIAKHVDHGKLAGTVDALSAGDLVLYHWYEKVGAANGQPAMRNNFGIIERASGKLIFSDVLLAEAMYPVPDSFFLHDGTLYFIKERSELHALRLG